MRQHDSHLATTYPKVGVCPKCRCDAFSGYVTGYHTMFDMYPLSQIGEAEALIRGLRTFHANHPHFERRSAWLIAREPKPLLGFIIREHRCTAPPPPPISIQMPKTKIELPDECPF